MAVKAHNTTTRIGIIKKAPANPNSKTQRRKANLASHKAKGGGR